LALRLKNYGQKVIILATHINLTPLNMKNPKKIKWLAQPEANNYPAANSYLNLFFDDDTAGTMVKKLKAAKVSQFKAKDIFRASALSLLGVSNSHVQKDRKKIKKQIKLSPLLLVRNSSNGRIIIADGYHRLCAIYSFDEDALIPCKIV